MLRTVLAGALFLLAPTTTAGEIPAANNLAETARTAQEQGRPVLVFFYMDGCEYCETVREQYLKPMSRDSKEAERVVLRQVDTRSGKEIADFAGNTVTQQDFAEREDKKFTPTLAFYGPKGRELAEPLVGLKGGTDFYGHYLDRAIEAAEEDLRSAE